MTDDEWKLLLSNIQPILGKKIVKEDELDKEFIEIVSKTNSDTK